jgi:hypothetical protein
VVKQTSISELLGGGNKIWDSNTGRFFFPAFFHSNIAFLMGFFSHVSHFAIVPKIKL